MHPFYNSKLAVILKSLSDEELRDFERWLDSPWANSGKKLQKLFSVIRSYDAEVVHKTLTKEQIHKKLYPRKAYSNLQLNNLFRNCCSQLEDFLTHQQLRKDNVTQKELLSQSLLEHQLSESAGNLIQKLINSLEKKDLKSELDYLKLSTYIDKLYFESSETNRYTGDHTMLHDASLMLDHYYALAKHRHWLEFSARQALLKETDRKSLKSLKDQWIHSDNGTTTRQFENDTFLEQLQLPAIQLYQQRLKRSKNWSWPAFEEYKQLLFLLFDKLCKTDQQFFLFCAINDTVVLYSHGHGEALRPMLDFYQFAIDKKLLLRHGAISGTTYNNIITISTQLKEIAFCKKFIKNYSHYLPSGITLDAQSWAKAQLLYATGDFDSCIDHLQQADFSTDFYTIQAKVTLLKALYDLTKSDPSQWKRLKSFCMSFEKYIRRNRIYSKERTSSYLRFIQFTRRLAAQHIQGDQIAIVKKLQKDLLKENRLFGKPWLEQRLAEIMPEEKEGVASPGSDS